MAEQWRFSKWEKGIHTYDSHHVQTGTYRQSVSLCFFFCFFTFLERSTVPSPKELRSTWSRVKMATTVSETLLTACEAAVNFQSSGVVSNLRKMFHLLQLTLFPNHRRSEDEAPCRFMFSLKMWVGLLHLVSTKNNTQQWQSVYTMCKTVTWWFKL